MATLIFMIVCGTLGVAFSKSPLLDAEYLLGRDWRLGTGGGGAGLKFSLLSRMATLGVSFGLVACLLVLVLSFCFATEFSVSGSLNSAHPFCPLWPLPHQWFCSGQRLGAPSYLRDN